jgi:hypothetical protein
VVVTYNDSTSFTTSLSGLGHALSTNEGATFDDLGPMPMNATGFGLGDPALVAANNGNFYSAELAFDFSRPLGFESTIAISKSTDGGKTFRPPVNPPVADVPIFSFQDKEFLAVNNVSNNGRGNLYLSWTNFQFDETTGFQSAPILFSRSTDGGATFSKPIQVSPIDLPGIQGDINSGSEPAVGPNGEVYVTWFKFPVSPFPGPEGGRDDFGAIYVAKSTDRGQTFGLPVLVRTLAPIGFGFGFRTLFGNFRVNSFPRIDVNPVNGEVYIVFAENRSGPDTPDSSDVLFTRSNDGGKSWSPAIRVNDDDPALDLPNDQFFPDVAVNRDGVIQVIWYDRRLDPDNLKIDVFRARSANGGVSFEANERVTSASASPAVGYDPFITPTYMGDYVDIKPVTRGDGRGTSFLLAWGDFRRVIFTRGGKRPDQDVVFTKLNR